MSSTKGPLSFKILAECSTTKARRSQLTLPHHRVDTPVFMPVGTQGTLKGLLPEQLHRLDCQILLGNTYHLGLRPGADVLAQAGGLHQFMNWDRALLTDSGGFQMVSLLQLAAINEEGVRFRSPFDGSSDCLLTPERSTQIQNSIGADIMMQLDDVVKTTTTGPRVEEAMHRTTRWLDRCLAAHKNTQTQTIFPIVQGGLDARLREQSARLHMQRDVQGFAIGGLSGGESKDDFWRMVHLSTDILPKEKPRYLMGVGFAVDLVVCSALGVDMFDCVFPTRTARFGCALVRRKGGQLNLRHRQHRLDLRPIDADCTCTTCQRYTRAYLHGIATHQAVSCTLLTVHNVAFQLKLMADIRQSICANKFPEFVRQFMREVYGEEEEKYPTWVVEALRAVNIDLLQHDG